MRNTELFPDKVSLHGFHIALYSSWLWWRGPEPSLLLKIAYSKQNGECPTPKQCQETTKQNKQHTMFFWSGQWLQDLGKRHSLLVYSWVSWTARLKNQRGTNELVICFYLALHLGEFSEKVWGLHTNRGWKFWQGPTRFRSCLPCFKWVLWGFGWWAIQWLWLSSFS